MPAQRPKASPPPPDARERRTDHRSPIKKVWLEQTVLAALLVTFQPTLALGYTPEPGFTYDQIPDQNLAIGLADVAAVDVSEFAGDGSCRTFQHTAIESTFGSFPTTFSVETCVDYIPLQNWKEGSDELEFIHEMLGYQVGAIVLIGHTLGVTPEAPLRYAIASCWGPMHLRVDLMTMDEQDGFLESVRGPIQESPLSRTAD